MRPIRLHLTGFGAFAQSTEIDFADVELFALTGPTGSGKTTVLDGICFALYGSVPRHGKGRVAAVITQGLLESTVALEFSLNETNYRVARRVNKGPKGQTANTNEASLEADGHTLAVGADAVTAAVERLLGLDFDQFTTCVLLPQGEFARFLHDKPAQRQDLLTALLDLGIYDRVSTLAIGRQRRAEGRLQQLDAELARLGEVSDIDLEAAQAREKEIDNLLCDVEERLPAIATLVAGVKAVAETLERTQRDAALLVSLEPPADWQEVGSEVAGQEAAVAAAKEELEAIRSQLADLIEAGASLPSRADVQSWLRARDELADVEKQRLSLSVGIDSLMTQAIEARVAHEEAITRDLALHLRGDLKLGDLCPVCGSAIEQLPASSKVGNLKALATKAKKAQEALDDARQSLSGLDRRRDDLSIVLADAATDLDALARTIAEHDEAVGASRRRLEQASNELTGLVENREQVAAREERVAAALQDAWSRATPLQPPFPDGKWQTLLDWRDERHTQVETAMVEQRRAAEEARARCEAAEAELAEMVATVGIDPTGRQTRDVVVEELNAARHKRQQIATALEDAARLTQEREEAVLTREVAYQLTLLLRANKFQNWLFDEVFAALVQGTNRLLTELTRGQYQLTMSGRDFEVIDHLSAGNRRSVKTLSGGETFLVSLAMAIALADEVASSAGAHNLESFFLDEGFGTLDAESLEVVSGVIGELGAQGKVVGIVTHVTELAEQMPVRYEIERGTGGAAVKVSSG
jgi:exonuclease SbcC